jgi:hypothetical protein
LKSSITSARAAALLLPVAALTSCGSNEGGEASRQAAAATEPAPAASPSPTGPFRISQYTALGDDCRVVRRAAEGEGDFSDADCPALAGYRVTLSESDLRADLVIGLPRGSTDHNLKLSEATQTGGFSHLGDRLEWRGRQEGDRFAPDAMIVRYLVVENPDAPERDTSYLLAVSLTGARPCVTARIAPGPGQNERARAAADAPGKCLA